MTTQFECDLFLESEAGTGAWNMAVDAALLDRYLTGNRVAVRLYRWSEPTLSLGYFQKDLSEVPAHLASLPVVPRLSGGGAILHDQELTYSCVVPAGHPFAHEPLRLYDVLHERLIAVLAEFGVTAHLRGAEHSLPGGGPFLCFARGDARDILIGEHKIVGSAQRRRKGGILQHGSILLEHSPFAPEFPGINDLLCGNAAVESARLQARLAEELPRMFGSRIRLAPLCEIISPAE